ncbi:hypothetical protein HDV00_006045 [Rhizophlyctis rosea]|nr:hypothetical protein HDV00_006045 [Rhizophlyctis rosea]
MNAGMLAKGSWADIMDRQGREDVFRGRVSTNISESCTSLGLMFGWSARWVSGIRRNCVTGDGKVKVPVESGRGTFLEHKSGLVPMYENVVAGARVELRAKTVGALIKEGE